MGELQQISLFGGHNFAVEPRTEPQVDPPLELVTWDNLEQECLNCAKCALRRGCRQVVFGEGNRQADLMLIGEAPGQNEDEQGRPFVGRAGQLLDKILAAAGFSRSEVYITNIVKCRPPHNRFPAPDEVLCCRPYVEKQIELVSPKIIVALGALAAQTLLFSQLRITRDRGIWREFKGIPVMPTFHPAALLRDESKKRPVWEDFKQIRDRYRQLTGGE